VKSLLGVLLTALLVIPALGCATTCPGTLLEGTLATQGDDVVVVQEPGGQIERLMWPAGYSVRRAGERLIVIDALGVAKAKTGDRVRLGGGETTGSGVWTVCGSIKVVEPAVR
jgi:hypothetical protein